MSGSKFRPQTQLIHGGEQRPRIEGAVTPPIFQSSTYEFGSGDKTGYDEIQYLRLNNSPNHRVLHRKLAILEGGQEGLVMSSGMAAIANTLLSLLGAGDHFLVQRGLYGGTQDLVERVLPDFGISCDQVQGDDPSSWKAALRPNTRVFYLESLTNPLLEVAEFEAVLEFSKRHNLLTVVDNTFTSPVNFRPLELGFDFSIHSATKYLNGHSDIVAGAVVGRGDLIARVRQRLNLLGACLDPHSCFLLHRGIKTLTLRVGYQNQSTLTLARFIENHPGVEKTLYPGLPSDPHHQRAGRYFTGCGGILSFQLKGGREKAEDFLKRLQLAVEAPSLGGVETLVTRPATTSHSGLSDSERQKLGIEQTLIRVSVGIEDTEDLIEDFRQAIG